MEGPELNKKLATDLSTLKLLIAYQIALAHKTLPDKVSVLRRLGLSLSEIATVCDTTPKTVSVRLAEYRRIAKRNKS
jgi:DNA-directed RNA polymerase specialized sigma24 family protein